MTHQLTAIPTVLMRGGTSKGVFFRAEDLPGPGPARDRVILGAFGSGDPRQIDGLGGADVLTSKVAIIGPPSRPDADVDYTFGQVGIDQPTIDWNGNCGNISSAVGVYAIEQGLVPAVSPETSVRVNNTNSDAVLRIVVPVEDGRPLVDGDFAISGVPGTGAEIRLDFSATAGATTGLVLPTGNVRDVFDVPGIGAVEASVVDVAKPAVFLRAETLGLDGTEGPAAYTSELLARYEAVQLAVSVAIGLDPAAGMPRPVSVAPAQPFTRLDGQSVSASEVDFLGRWVVTPHPAVHKAFAGTGAACTGVAARIPGTVVHEVCTPSDSNLVRIGHPSGVFPVRAEVDGGLVREASFSRTARRLLEGTVYVRSDVLAGV